MCFSSVSNEGVNDVEVTAASCFVQWSVPAASTACVSTVSNEGPDDLKFTQFGGEVQKGTAVGFSRRIGSMGDESQDDFVLTISHGLPYRRQTGFRFRVRVGS